MDASHGCSRHRTSDVADGSHSPSIRIARGSKARPKLVADLFCGVGGLSTSATRALRDLCIRFKLVGVDPRRTGFERSHRQRSTSRGPEVARPRGRDRRGGFGGGGLKARTLFPAVGLYFTAPSVPSQKPGNHPVGQPPRSFWHGQPHASLFVACSHGVYVAGFPRSLGVNAVEPGLHNAAGSLRGATGGYNGPSVSVHDLNSPEGLSQIRLRLDLVDILLQGVSLLHPKDRIHKWFSRWSEISHVAGGFQHLARNLGGVSSRLIAQAFRGINLQELGVEVDVLCPLLDRHQQLCISDPGPRVDLRPSPDFVLVRDTKRDEYSQQGSDCRPSIPIDRAPLADYPALADPLSHRPQPVIPAHWRHPLSVSEPILT